MDIELLEHGPALTCDLLKQGELSDAAQEVGLALHPDKTKILHSLHCETNKSWIPATASIKGMEIEILPVKGHTKYLGRKLSFSDPHRVEVENRIACAWKKFHSLRQELLGNMYSLKDRMRLFDGVITSTLLYGCEAWTLTVELQNRIRRTQQQMLRMIIQTPRRKLLLTPTDTVDPEQSGSDIDSTSGSPEPLADTDDKENLES